MSESPPPNQRTGRSRLDSAVSLALICASAAFVWLAFRPPVSIVMPGEAGSDSSRTPRQTLGLSPVLLEPGARLGTPTASVGAVIYFDYECPSCGRLARETLPMIIADYVDTGRVRLAFRNLPLETIHRNALAAAIAGECASLHGRFIAVHDGLFASPARLDPNTVMNTALSSGVSASQYRECLTGDTEKRVRADIAEAKSLGITGTPTMLFGRLDRDGMLAPSRIEKGALPTVRFKQILDGLLAASQ